MSVLIKGIDLPKCGWYLDLVITADGVVRDYGIEDEQIAEAIELPDHGDLIDRDALLDSSPVYVTASFGKSTEFISRCKVNNAPVVIPAERSSDGCA